MVATSIAGQGARDGAIRTDQPEIKPQLLSDGQGKRVTASCNDDNFDTLGMSPTQSVQIDCGDMEFGVKQGTVNINGNETKGIGRHKQF